MSDNIVVEWYSLNNINDDLKSQWDTLAMNQAVPLPMATYAWQTSLVDTLLSSNEEIVVCMLFDNNRLCGLLSLVIKPGFMKRMHVSTPYYIHSAFSDLLVSDNKKNCISAIVLREIKKRYNKGLYEVAFRGYPEDSILTSSDIINVCHLCKLYSYTQPRGTGSYLPVISDWKTWNGSLSKNILATIRKSKNRIKKDLLPSPEYKWLQGKEITSEYFNLFIELEASGWKGRQGSAIKNDKLLHQFYLRIHNKISELGWLELHLMSVNGEIIAAHFGVRMKRTLILLKIAFDENYARYTPGSLLFFKMMEKIYSDQDIDEVNCLTDMRWHQTWKMRKRNFNDLRLYPYNFIAMAYMFAYRTAKAAYNTIRRQ